MTQDQQSQPESMSESGPAETGPSQQRVSRTQIADESRKLALRYLSGTMDSAAADRALLMAGEYARNAIASLERELQGTKSQQRRLKIQARIATWREQLAK